MPSWLTSIFSSLFSSTAEFTATAVQGQIAAFRTFLNGGGNTTIRFWVEAGASYGHQSATANLVYRMARPVGDGNQNFAYNGTMEIYYEEDGDLPKLRQLIPELLNQPPKINDATLTAIKYTARPGVAVNFGFTGGANRNEDYADKLNVTYFLRLQPYRWPGAEQIERPGQAPVDLTKVAELGTGFGYRLFYMDSSLYSNPPFDSFPNDEKVKIVRLITHDDVLQKFALLTAYSIKSGISRLNANAVYGAALICGSVMSWQKRGDKLYKKAKPAVIMNFDDFGTATVSEEAEVRKVLKGELAASENGLAATLAARSNNETAKANYARRKAFFEGLDSENRFTYLNYPATADAVGRALEALVGRKDQVVFLQLGRTPSSFFSYAVTRSTLPALFEGQNTANLAINTGVPYMQVPAPNMSEEDKLKVYPSVTLSGLNPDEVPIALAGVAMQIASLNSTWPESSKDAPCLIVGDYYRQVTDSDSKSTIPVYFRELKKFFAQPAKDKFISAVAYLNSIRPSTSLGLVAVPADNPLNALYSKLRQSVTIGQPLNLVPGILTEGTIPAFIQSFLQEYAAGLTLTVDVFDHQGEPPGVTEITLEGPTPAFASIGVSCGVRVVFTAPDGRLTSRITFADKQTWTMPNVPWVVLRDPYISILVPNGKSPVVATFGGYYPALESENPPIKAKLEIGAGNRDLWPASISFEQTYPGIASAFQMAASINLVQSLPAPFNALTDLGVSHVELQYDYANSVLRSILITARSNTQNLPLFGTLTLGNIVVSTTLIAPATTRGLTVAASAEFAVGKTDPAIIGVSIGYPGLTLQGELLQGVITIEKLLSTFLPDYQLSLPQVPAIDQFSFSYNRAADYLVVTLNLNIQWTFAFFGQDLFLIENAGFEITRIKGSNTGLVTGNTVLLPKSARIGVMIAANYLGEGNWRFQAKQTSGVVDLNALLAEYLGPQWVPPIQFPKLDGLGVTLDWQGGSATSFELTAKTATSWTPILALPEATVMGNATIGYRSGTAPAPVDVPTQDLPGAYGKISAEFTLWNIALEVTYNFNPKTQNLCIVWLAATACLSQQGGETVAVFRLNGKSIGQMVEMFVSWATGAAFGLSAPWNLLNDITLNGFSVEYNFTRKTVSFHVGIGPIDFGLFSLEGVTLAYDPKQTDGKVQIKIDGTFTWEPDKESLSWDPTRPEATPAPPGGGNKYLDLRLLALGQHVTVAGLVEQRQVQDVIKMLRDLKVPKPPEIPVGGPGQPIPAPLNSWFVAFDFGVLKVEEKNVGAKPAYFIQLSAVFNDPILYALQIALDGPMAKVFAGLNFQIMYRQVSDTAGCYSSQIALPNIMRKLQVGVATVTLPVFGIEVYTNGDFQVDVGFPWQMDFSRSFTIEAIIPPGIPVLGSGGFYFGKLSSATTDKVPAAINGWFNPVLVFGFGLQVGLGKSIEAGILRAGFSLTVFGIIEGVIARWLPYTLPTPPGQRDQLQDGYYFALTGTVGLQGRLYGTVDFAIVKATVDVSISIYIRITFIAYEDILIHAAAAVRIRVSIEIDLGLFSITISFSFSATVEASFVLANPMGNNPPWITRTAGAAAHALRQRRVNRLLAGQPGRLGAAPYTPNWGNLLKGTQVQLDGWLAPVLTVAGDLATTPAQQSICYVVSLFLPVPPPVQTPHPQSNLLLNRAARTVEEARVAHAALERARLDTAADTFEDLAVRVLQWVIAAGLPDAMTPEQVDQQVVTHDFLASALDYLAGATTPTPVPVDAIEAFLGLQTRLLFALATGGGRSSGAFFPVPPGTTLEVPQYPPASGPPKYKYAFGDYNSSSSTYLSHLNDYFNELRVQVQAEDAENAEAARLKHAAAPTGPSVASYIFSDYFALIGRQAVQALLDGLKNFKMVIDANLTVQQMVDWVNGTGKITDPQSMFTAGQLFKANESHLLSMNASGPLTIRGMAWQTPGGKSFHDISTESIFDGGFDDEALATLCSGDARILAANVKVTYKGADYLTQSGDSLDSIAAYFEIALSELLGATDVLTNPALVSPLAVVTVPDFPYPIAAKDKLSDVAARFGVSIDALAAANPGVAGLFDAAGDPNLNVPELVQFQVKELIDEAKRMLALQNLAAMTSRFYLNGLRLPTQGLTANHDGLFVTGSPGNYQYPENLGLFALTGQAFPLPDIAGTDKPQFSFSLLRGAAETWLNLGIVGGTSVTFSLDSSDDFQRYKSVRDFALANRLRTGVSAILGLGTAETQPARFPLAQQSFWQAPVAVTLPRQTVTPPTPRPCLWQLPDSLVNLPASQGLLPLFKPVLARTDAATGSTVEQGVANYGFGTLITFSLRRTQPVAGSTASGRFYELVGATEKGTLLLERLLDQLRSDDSGFQQMTLLYRPASTGSRVEGWQSDDQAVSLMGIGQVNLSTETRPPASLAGVVRETLPVSNVINTPTEFLRLLWEASITRQGGFYLSYTTGIGTNRLQGLPERLFGSGDVAEVSVLALFNVDSAVGQSVADYMNVVATNEQFDLSDAALIAEAVTVQVTTRPFSADDTLAGFAAEYYTDPSLIASMNQEAALAGVITVAGGRYEVPAPDVAPGGDLDQIAVYFNTTVQAIQAANKNRTDWPNPLPQYTGLILPPIDVSIGIDVGGSTFASLAEYYHAPIAGLAAANGTVQGLFANGKALQVLAGPLTLAPLVQPGVTGFHCSRNAPPPLPSPGDPNWGNLYLLNLFNLLGYRVAGNPDFRVSAWGLPAGPASPASHPPADKIQAPQAAAAGDDWIYTRTLPYPKLYKNPPQAEPAGLPTPSDSPYLGVGGLIQFELAWQDLFGNRILSELSQPQDSTDAPLNLPPQIAGYTDRLLGVGQWPAVANAFRVTPDANDDPSLELLLAFDKSQYLEPGSEARIRRAVAIYQQILFQLGDPNGVDISLTTTVTPQAGSLLSPQDKSGLRKWVENIYLWLNSLLPPPPPPPPPPGFDPNLTLSLPLDGTKINTGQIFRVSAAVTISRNPRLVDGELSTAAGTIAASSPLAPWTGPLSGEETRSAEHRRFMTAASLPVITDPASVQRDIAAFAAAFTVAFVKVPGVTFHIATGSDRNAFTSGNLGNLWAVQLGSAQQSTAISYTVTSPGEPKQFAPRPVSNQLASRARTPIISYQTGKAISLDDPSVDRAFASIDLDQWMQYTVTQIDSLLTPKYVAPALILRDKKAGPDALQKVLDAKKALAGALKNTMIPVFKDESATGVEKKAIQEVFYQSLLGLVGQFYAVKAGIQFAADVAAAIAPDPGDIDPPRLYGDISSSIAGMSKAGAPPLSVQALPDNASLSSPKLNLKFAGGGDSPHYLSFLLSSTTSREASIPLNLKYSCQYLEHQIGKLSGIDGYQPSSWLSFADDTTTAAWPLNSELGQFDVPLVLRSFPETPTLVRQESLENLVSPCHQPSARALSARLLLPGAEICDKPGDFNPLAGATLWSYGFAYSQQVHYLQDAVHGEIRFNVAMPRLLAGAALPERDLFDNLAEFTTVYPQVQADLDRYLVVLDVDTTGSEQIKNAQAALESAANLIQWVADTAADLDTSLRLDAGALAGNAEPFPFTITEVAVQKQNPDGSMVEALSVVVVLPAPPPPRVGKPLVQIQPDTYNCQPDGGDAGTFRFVYTEKTTGDYLTTDVGLTIAGRTFVLPDLDVLERQDSQASVYLTRNENLAGKPIAGVFVYTTPTVSFPAPLLPTLRREQPVNLATLYAVDGNTPVTRSLSCQLALLYEVLFQNAGTDSVTLTLTAYYEYSPSRQIPNVRLPVFLMPPTQVAIRQGGAGEPIADIIAEQVQGCQGWFQSVQPVTTKAVLFFDLTIMSNLTERPMPVLRLSGLNVPLAYLNPPLG
jgi:LysM repeat protein